MRNQFVQTSCELVEQDERLVVLLGEVTIWGFRFAMAAHPDRIMNIGILEQASISFAAGLSISGLIPVFHTFSPFLTERAYEQLKLDFGYQKLGGNFVSMGASFDNAVMGATHHSPADVSVLKQIPDMQIIVPGTKQEFDSLYRSEYANGEPTYFRLTDHGNAETQKVSFGKANVLKTGSKATVVVVGPALETVWPVVKDQDVTVLYYTTVAPFDYETLRNAFTGGRVLLCEPFYTGTLAYDVQTALQGLPFKMEMWGVPHRLVRNYGSYDQIMAYMDMTTETVAAKLQSLLA